MLIKSYQNPSGIFKNQASLIPKNLVYNKLKNKYLCCPQADLSVCGIYNF